MGKKIPVAKPDITHKEINAVTRTVSTGWITMGKKVQEFEKKVSKFLNVKHAMAINNGTSALDVILSALEIMPGDEIIVPSLTYISTANVVLYKNAKLILCDSDENTFNTNFNFIKKKISKKTKLIIATDMKGLPLDYDDLDKIRKIYKIPIIIDSAESFSAKYKGHQVGKQFLAHTFSFFANKNLTTGEGGMVVTNSNKLAEKIKILRNQGQLSRYKHIMLGNNYRMTDISASIGIEQLKKIKKNVIRKNIIAKIYNKSFKNNPYIQIPTLPNYVSQHSWYNYCIKVPKNKRDKLVKYLKKNNIETRVSFPPVHIQPYYKKKFEYKCNDYPNSYNAYKKMIDIPIWPGLTTFQAKHISKKILEFFQIS